MSGTQTKSISEKPEWTTVEDPEPNPFEPIHYPRDNETQRHRSAGDVGFKPPKDDDGKSVSHYLYSGQNNLGELKEDGSIRVKTQHFEALDAKSTSGTVKYTVSGGESLRQISQMFFGTGDFWYVIADANGLAEGPDTGLTAGRILDVPQQNVQTNSFDEFKPFNLGQAIGDTTPSLPFIPPPPDSGCGALGTIIMVVIAIVVTVYTAGAATGVTTGLFQAGTAALSGTAGLGGLGAVGASVVGGFAGSVVSQGVGKAIGAIDHFSLRSAVTSGLTAGAAAGLGSALGVGNEVAAGAKASNGFTKVVDIGKGLGKVALNSAGKALAGFSSVVSSAAANKIVGNPSGFRWSNVVASAGASFIGSEIGLSDPDSNLSRFTGNDSSFGLDLFSGVANAGISHAIKKGFFNEGKFDFKSVATDAFANAVGNGIVRAQSGGTFFGAADTTVKDKVVDENLTQAIQKAKEEGADAQSVAKVIQKQLASSGAVVDTSNFFDNGISISLDGNNPLEFDLNALNDGSISIASIQSSIQSFVGDELFKNNDLLSLDLGLTKLRADASRAERDLRITNELSLLEARGRASAKNGFGTPASGGVTQAQIDAINKLGPRTTFGDLASDIGGAIFDTVAGTADILATGAVNGVVELSANVAALPFALESIDAFMAVKKGIVESHSLSLTTDGAKAFGEFVAPLGVEVQSGLTELRVASENTFLGDLGTTVLFGLGEAVLEVGAFLGGVKGVKSGLKAGLAGKVADDVVSNSAGSAVRERVLANIAESSAAREAFNLGGGLTKGEISVNRSGIQKLFSERGFNESVIDNVIIGSGKAPFSVSRGFKGDEFFIDSSLKDFLKGKGASGLFIRDKLLNSLSNLDRQNLLALPLKNNAFITQKAILSKDQILLRSVVRSQGGNKSPLVFGKNVVPGGGGQIITAGGVRSGAIEIFPKIIPGG